MDTQQRRYLSASETAQLVRKALKARFPSVKFSVRSSNYSGGASIRVSYTDGPRQKDVEAVTSLYTGSTFDGMQDLKEYHDSLIMSANGIEKVHFGADYVFVTREYSQAVLEDMLARCRVALDVENDRQFGWPTYAAKAGVDHLDLCWRDGNVHEWAGHFLAQIEYGTAD